MLGIFPEGAYKTLRATLSSGDRFMLYTDGITEAPSPSGEEFGMERLKDFLRQNSGHSTQELCDLLIRQVAAWCAGGAQEQHDDLTLIVVDYKAA